MISTLIIVALVFALFKGCGFVLGVCGKLIGILFSMIGYVIIAAIAVALFHMALIIVPIILVAGVVAIIGALATA